MAKQLKKVPITVDDLNEFVNDDSDFGFEMRVLRVLRSEDFDCSHSGTYRDPVTNKARQYDIRAQKDRGNLTLALAVECKNLRPNYPLLLSAVQRTPDEAFHDLITLQIAAGLNQVRVSPRSGHTSAYKAGEKVAKNIAQVGRALSKPHELIDDDETTFDKMNQAINSCRDLVQQLANKSTAPWQRAIVPVLVVPTDRLWQVDYGADGSVVVSPRQVERCSLFCGHAWLVSVGDTVRTLSYRLSHIEIVTFDALATTARAWLGPEGFLPLSG